MRCLRSLLLVLSLGGFVFGQGTLPNPFFQTTMSPWAPDTLAQWSPDQFSKSSVVIPGGTRLRVNTDATFKQFFGQGINVIMMTAAGIRDTTARNAPFDFTGAFSLNKPGSSFARACEIPTAAKSKILRATPYGTLNAFAWAINVNPGGNGSGSFTINTDDGLGIVVRSAESFFLIQKSSLPPGGAAGYLITGVAPGGPWDTYAVTSQLNDLTAAGYTPNGILNVAGYAPTGFSKVTLQAKATQSNSKVQIALWNWGAGCGAGSWVNLPETPVMPGTTVMQTLDWGTAGIGAAYSSTITVPVNNPTRFVEASTGVVLVRLTLAPKMVMMPSPNALSVRAFRLQ